MVIFLSFFILDIIYSAGIKQDRNNIALKYIDDNYEIIKLDPFFDFFNNAKMKLYESDCYDFLYYIKTLLNRYIYLDILKNPPQEESYYHTKVDLLETIPDCSPNYYIFYSSIKKWLSQAEDEHLNINFNYIEGPENIFPYRAKKYLRESFVISPIRIHISKKGEVFAIPSKFITYFDEKIQKIIQNNKNNSIYKINNKDPISYITTFNDNFHELKSKQAQFVRNQYLIELFDFDNYPFKKEHLNGIKIIYSNNNQSITYDYLILLPRLNVTITFDEFRSHIYNNLETSEIKWDEATSYGQLKCKVDKDNHVNVIYQNSFSF